MRKLSGRRLILAALLTLGLSGVSAESSEDFFPQRPLGEVRLISGPAPCDGQVCFQVAVQCPQLAERESATLKVGPPLGSPFRGTILFKTGGAGKGFWEHFGTDARRVLRQLREAGFRTVQVAWTTGWLIGAPGELEGQARLACRAATVARWVYDNLHDSGPDATLVSSSDDDSGSPRAAFCATGNSGGAAQVSYMLAQYGLADILSAVLPTGGPPMGRIDLGCVRDDPDKRHLWYSPHSAALIDKGFGFLEEGSGPCFQSVASFRHRFQEASVALGPWQFVYPETMVWFVFGENDRSNAVPQGLTYYKRLIHEGSPLVRVTRVPDTPHATPSTRQGADTIRNILLRECRPR